MVVEFIGGPKDGEVLEWAGDCFTVVTVSPVYCPWGRDDLDDEGPWKVERVGVYVRNGSTMTWNPE